MIKDPYSDSDIAKLLLLESQNYQADYSRLDNSIITGKALKTNKRFLKSVIRNVNDHNRQLERNTERSLTPARVTEEDDEDQYSSRHKNSRHSHGKSLRTTELGSQSHGGPSRSHEKAPRRSWDEEHCSSTSRKPSIVAVTDMTLDEKSEEDLEVATQVKMTVR
ncbi:hypothetical protein PSHT_11609 [Puccinia striiformis]|uniref:Uncharacterized protein n=1 Tax=Puccinia striiformis TaxID=27350 RepID=A0A2S4V2G9_9BASI|nr:hypothetical protein PSHT_11609 [Puccinia striiformis]